MQRDLRGSLPSIPRGELLDGGFHHHLLLDEARRGAFARAVHAAVRPGDVVADIGSGSGILAWHAARAGAKRVFAVEANTHSYRTLLRAVRANGVSDRVTPVLADGTQWQPPERVDVVVCELMETGLIHEPIAAVMRNVRGWKHAPRAVLPQEVVLEVEGVRVRSSFDGYEVPLSGFRATVPDEAVTTRAAYARYAFEREAPDERVDAAFEVRALRDGAITGLQLWTRSRVFGDVALESSPGYCAPAVLALDGPVHARAGDKLRGRVAYDFDDATTSIEFDLHA